MKVYVIRDLDIEALLTAIDRDPRHGERGGSSQVLTQQEQDAHDRAHRFYNFQVRRWLDEVRQP
jgi:hypothetical protein